LSKTGVCHGEFHDFRRTFISKWSANGLSEFDVMNMAGHSNFETTRRYYLAISEGLLDRTRTANSDGLQGIFIAKPLQRGFEAGNKKSCQAQVIDSQGFNN
jgi:hypothetical protein